MLLASSALSQSSSAGLSVSRISSTTFLAAWRWMKSWRTVFNGFSLFCASCNCCCSFASSVAAMVLTFSLSNRFTAACFAFKYMRASPMADWAAFVAASVSPTARCTSSRLSPPATIISEVMEAFSTASSALLALSVASGIISWKSLLSLSSASRALASSSTLEREPRIFASSAATAPPVAWTCAPSCAKSCCAGPGAAVRCTSPTFRCSSVSGPACGASSCSACCRLASEVKLPAAARACSSACRAGASNLDTSAERPRARSSASWRCCSAFATTTRVDRTGPSQGIFQPLLGGCISLLVQCDQTWVPPSLLPNHQPSKAGPSRWSQ
mmetsp:Transcript_35760/g.99075  ORF Transcript_35760/g.99075 Transcript_35760/m.99075 type:complete len:328 (+) Transcript_35760:4893-5876(+)